ncbi:hypothetical protein [Candidatus Poriferisodalis sp.]
MAQALLKWSAVTGTLTGRHGDDLRRRTPWRDGTAMTCDDGHPDVTARR